MEGVRLYEGNDDESFSVHASMLEQLKVGLRTRFAFCCGSDEKPKKDPALACAEAFHSFHALELPLLGRRPLHAASRRIKVRSGAPPSRPRAPCAARAHPHTHTHTHMHTTPAPFRHPPAPLASSIFGSDLAFLPILRPPSAHPKTLLLPARETLLSPSRSSLDTRVPLVSPKPVCLFLLHLPLSSNHNPPPRHHRHTTCRLHSFRRLCSNINHLDRLRPLTTTI